MQPAYTPRERQQVAKAAYSQGWRQKLPTQLVSPTANIPRSKSTHKPWIRLAKVAVHQLPTRSSGAGFDQNMDPRMIGFHSQVPLATAWTSKACNSPANNGSLTTIHRLVSRRQGSDEVVPTVLKISGMDDALPVSRVPKAPKSVSLDVLNVETKWVKRWVLQCPMFGISSGWIVGALMSLTLASIQVRQTNSMPLVVI